MMNQVFKTLPDNRPITSLIVVEDVDRCPKGYVPVSKTHDQDSDADLWRESGFFGRKCTRYLCLSKTEGAQYYLVQSLTIINEKEMPPQGYKSITKTSDSELKAWRKKQLCYKYVHTTFTQTAVTDIIVLSRTKKAPEGFLLLGEINGVTLCYKIGNIYKEKNPSPYAMVPNRAPPESVFGTSKTDSDNNYFPDYRNQPPRSSQGEENGFQNSGAEKLRPFRPAPKPPASTYATISGYNGLEGVPFILNPKFNFTKNSSKDLPVPKPKTFSQIEEEYSYEFRTERET